MNGDQVGCLLHDNDQMIVSYCMSHTESDVRHPRKFVTMVLVQRMPHQHVTHLVTAAVLLSLHQDMDGQNLKFQFSWMI